MLIAILGGTASGKSGLAVEIAAAAGGSVTFVATGVASDSAMRDRIELHRRDRPSDWSVVEEPLELGTTIAAIDEGATVLVDSISGWLGNRMEAVGGTHVDWGPARARELAEECVAALQPLLRRSGRTVCVSAEVGLAPVPLSNYGRGFGDALGRLNQALVAAAGEAYLVAAGVPIPLHTFRR